MSELHIAIAILIEQNGGRDNLATQIENEWRKEPTRERFFWNENNTKVLIDNYEKMSRVEIAEIFDITKEQVQKKISHLRSKGLLPLSERCFGYY